MTKFSVVIPVESWNEAWHEIIDDLVVLPHGSEIILVMPHDDHEPDNLADIKNKLSGKSVIITKSQAGLAKTLNAGANAASGEYLWFLNGDLRFTKESFIALEDAIKNKPDAIHYFVLKFLTDGPKIVRLNQIGSKMRSVIFNVPFIDQALCLKKEIFNKYGQFDESLQKGEEQAFIWKARKDGVKLNLINSDVTSSARKYDAMGWMHLTFANQLIWLKPAISGFSKLAEDFIKKNKLDEKAKKAISKVKRKKKDQ